VIAWSYSTKERLIETPIYSGILSHPKNTIRERLIETDMRENNKKRFEGRWRSMYMNHHLGVRVYK
jgi:hypothetical protein